MMKCQIGKFEGMCRCEKPARFRISYESVTRYSVGSSKLPALSRNEFACEEHRDEILSLLEEERESLTSDRNKYLPVRVHSDVE